MLRQHGYPEAEVREHSLHWLQVQCEAVRKRLQDEQELIQARQEWTHKQLVVDLLSTVPLATAAGMGSEKAWEHIQEMLSDLTSSEGESSDDWLLNPDATTDLDAFRASMDPNNPFRPKVLTSKEEAL